MSAIPFKSDSFEGSVRMADINRLKVKERRLLSDLLEAMDSDMNEFDCLDLIDDHISDLTHISRKYKDVHYSLEDELGDVDYRITYPRFDETNSKARAKIKKAKSAKARMEQQKEQIVEQAKVTDQIELCLCKVVNDNNVCACMCVVMLSSRYNDINNN